MAKVHIHPQDAAVIPDSVALGPGVGVGNGVIPEGSDSRYTETHESLDGGPTLMQMRGELEEYCADIGRTTRRTYGCPECPGKEAGCPGYRGGITPNARLSDSSVSGIFWRLTWAGEFGNPYG